MTAMAVAATPKLDAERLRADFPFLEELQNGLPVAFLDSAASTQKPRQVLEAMTDFYSHSYANVHRGVYRLAERATDAYEGARVKVAGFVNAPSEREIVFTRQATEALNLVAYAWGLDNLGPGDLVLVSELEQPFALSGDFDPSIEPAVIIPVGVVFQPQEEGQHTVEIAVDDRGFSVPMTVVVAQPPGAGE